jgi:hypothetical protein
MTKTAMTIFLEFLEKCRDEKKEFDYDILIAFATELRDTAEKFDIMKANIGLYDDDRISDDELRELAKKAKLYYESTYQNVNLE